MCFVLIDLIGSVNSLDEDQPQARPIQPHGRGDFPARGKAQEKEKGNRFLYEDDPKGLFYRCP